MDEESQSNRKVIDQPVASSEQSAEPVDSLVRLELPRLFDSTPGAVLAVRLMELLPAAVYTCDAPSGVITYYNRRAAELWGREPAIGDTDERFCGSFRLFRTNGKPLPHAETPMAQVLNGAAPVRSQEVVIERPNGSRITVLVNIDPLMNASGEITGAINVFADVSDMKRAEQASRQLAAIVESSEDAIISKDLNGIVASWNQAAERLFGYTAAEIALRESEESLRQHAQELEQQLIMSGRLVSLGEVTASMAHEFNNPLGIIMGFVEDMLSGMDSADPNYRALQIIDEESKRCRQIVRDLMEYARPRNVEFCSTSIADAIEKTLQLVANRLYKQNVAVERKLKPDLPRIQADAQQLEQVLVNLYLNAIDAMPQGGQLIVEATLAQSGDAAPGVAIAVTDTGFGIAETDLPKIFQPFFTAKKRRGMGLGLPICQRIINNHGGRIEVESVPGAGSTFRIYLPSEQRATTESREPLAASEAGAPIFTARMPS
jgi:PAS domain S-box-containing protein